MEKEIKLRIPKNVHKFRIDNILDSLERYNVNPSYDGENIIFHVPVDIPDDKLCEFGMLIGMHFIKQ